MTATAPAPDRAVMTRPTPEDRGAPDVPLWRNPTAWLLVAVLLTWGGASALYLTGRWPAWATMLVNTIALYVGFTVMHEAVHRVADRRKAVNDAMGWVPGLLLFFTLPVFRTCHSKHHANTNDPELDPDHAVARMPAWLRVWWLAFTIYNYRRLYYGRRWWRSGREAALQVAVDVVLVGGIVLAVATDLVTAWAVVHLVPALAAGIFLAWAFDFLPHRPHDSTERYHDTRIQPGRVRHALLLGQNYHLVHHLWVTIPWYRYRRVFDQLRPHLEAEGARIE